MLNGKTLIDRKEVEGLTAIASDPIEAEPGRCGPGDYGSVECRKFTLDAAREGWRKSANEAMSLSLMGLPL